MNISFVIPAYNSQETIRETVDSIFDGNFTIGDEIIIVNDCSSDDTLTVLKDLSKKYDLKILNNIKNIGCPATRNVGIKEAKNKLIFSLDSDNILSKNSVLDIKKCLLEQKADITSFGSVNFFNKDKSKVTHKWVFKNGWFNLSDIFAGNINPAPLGNYLFTKDSWQKVGGFSELGKGLHEAWIFTFKQLLSGSKFFVSNKNYYYHRYGHESLTIREYKNNTEKEILRSVIFDKLNMFEPNDAQYIEKNNPFWIHDMNKRPIKLNGKEIGKNGKISRTCLGYINYINKKIKNVFK